MGTRSAKRDIETFRNRYYGNQNCNMYIDDFTQIMDSTKKLEGGYYLQDFDKYDLMVKSWQAGFMVGYRKAQRDMKKNRRS